MESSQERQEGKRKELTAWVHGCLLRQSAAPHQKGGSETWPQNTLILHTCISDKQVHRWCKKERKKSDKFVKNNNFRMACECTHTHMHAHSFTQTHYLNTFSLLTSMLLTVLWCSLTFFFLYFYLFFCFFKWALVVSWNALWGMTKLDNISTLRTQARGLMEPLKWRRLN